jgi:cold shock CspA family protein
MLIAMKGYFNEFVLVDENSEIFNGYVNIENHFIIPANIKELSFPLIYGDENINFEAHISSSELPLSEAVECELKLTYNYEDETPYKLTFIALDKSVKSFKVKWREIQYQECENLPILAYPPKKTWGDFLKDPKKDGSGYSNLLEWIEERLSLLEINRLPQYIIEKEIKEIIEIYGSQEVGYFEWGQNDKNGKYYCRVNVNGESIFCHSSNFIENINPSDLKEGQKIYLNVIQGKGGKTGKNIRLHPVDIDFLKQKRILKLENELKGKSIYDKTEKIYKGIKSIRYPILTVWNDHSLNDYDVPNDFRNRMLLYVNLALQLFYNDDVSDKTRNELFFILSALHKDMPHEISNELLKISENLEEEKRYFLNLALSLGKCELLWQQKILDNIMSYINNAKLQQVLMNILSIASWRSEKFVFNLLKYDLDLIIKHLFLTLNVNIKNLNNNGRLALSNAIKQFELLLALIRIREKKSDLLCPQQELTKKYIKLIDTATKYFIENDIRIKTRLTIELEKPDIFKETPDLLYALRVYLTGDDGAANTIKILGVSDD